MGRHTWVNCCGDMNCGNVYCDVCFENLDATSEFAECPGNERVQPRGETLSLFRTTEAEDGK